MVLQDVDLGIAHAVQSHGAQRQLLQVTVNTRLDSSANHRSYVLDVPLHFLPHVCERPAHRSWRDKALRLEEVAVSAIGGRRVRDVGREEKQLHQAFGAVDGPWPGVASEASTIESMRSRHLLTSATSAR